LETVARSAQPRRAGVSLTLEQKQAVVTEVHALAAQSQSAIAAVYTGMTVEQMTQLRARARKGAVDVRVVKNTLARRAVVDTDFACLHAALTGPLALIFSRDDPGAGARIVREYAKQHDNLVVKAIALSGVLYPAEGLEKLANLPTLEQARAMLLGVLQAPATRLVRTLAEPAAQFVRVLAAYRERKAEC
jgi:large subunit ribosomal protein L10